MRPRLIPASAPAPVLNTRQKRLTKPLGEIVACVVDNGMFVELARVLGQSYKTVYYHVPWQTFLPSQHRGRLGTGIEEITPLLSMFDPAVFDDIDLFIFPDVNHGPEQLILQRLGKFVWGSRMGELLELDRDGTKEAMTRVGLPVGPYQVIHGVDQLRAFLKTHPDWYVKIDRWRKHFETFCSTNYRETKPRIDELAHYLGPLGDITDFVVEKALPGRIEAGIDGYCIDGQLPDEILTGIEIKDRCYLGMRTPYASVPASVTGFSRAMFPLLQAYQYRGFYSDETRVGRDGVGHMIDACCRMAAPPGEAYQGLYLNLAEIIARGSGGELVQPRFKSKFCAEVIMKSWWAEKGFLPLTFPTEHRDNVKLWNAVRINSQYVIVPQEYGMAEIGAIVGYGNSAQAAIDQVKEIAKDVEGIGLEIPLEAFDEVDEEADKARSYGIPLFGRN